MFSVRVAMLRTPEWGLRKWPFRNGYDKKAELHQKQRSASNTPLLTKRCVRHCNLKIFNRVSGKRSLGNMSDILELTVQFLSGML